MDKAQKDDGLAEAVALDLLTAMAKCDQEALRRVKWLQELLDRRRQGDESMAELTARMESLTGPLDEISFPPLDPADIPPDFFRRMSGLEDEEPAPVAEKPAEKLYYILDQRSIVGNCAMLWAKNSAGYTTELDNAGLYDEAFIKTLCRESDVPVPREDVERLAVRHVRIDTMRDRGVLKAVGRRGRSVAPTTDRAALERKAHIARIKRKLRKIERYPPPCLSDPVCNCEVCERYCDLYRQLQLSQLQED